jgi:hypothetical protein
MSATISPTVMKSMQNGTELLVVMGRYCDDPEDEIRASAREAVKGTTLRTVADPIAQETFWAEGCRVIDTLIDETRSLTQAELRKRLATVYTALGQHPPDLPF